MAEIHGLKTGGDPNHFTGMILQGMACLVKENPHIDFCQKPSFFRCQAHLTRPSTFASSTIDAGLHLGDFPDAAHMGYRVIGIGLN